MTLQQLIYAVTIASTGSVNKAAKQLFLSQSSLSASILNLEQEIGINLFHRTNRGVTITPEGEEFLIHARQIVNQYKLTEEKFILKRETRKSFQVSSQHYTFAVKAFIEMAKQFELDRYAFGMHECKTTEVIENVKNYHSEIGVLYVDDFNHDILMRTFSENDLIFTELFSCKIFVFLADCHPLAKNNILDLDDLQPYPCLSFDQGENSAFYLAEEVYSARNYKHIINVSDRATMLNLMIGLNGYTLCSGIMCEDLNGKDYTVIPLKSDKIMRIGYIRRKDSQISNMAQIYIDELKKCSINII